MALPATGVIEVRIGGSDTQCSGGFNPARGGTDYSLQNAAQATGTVTSATTTVTATTGIFTSVMVGNYITDGTIYKEITAFTSATIVTVDSAPTWTAATIYVGGAFASIGKATAVGTGAGSVIFVKYNASPFVTTTASTNVATGCVAGGAGVTFCGYDTTRTLRNTDANRPTLQIGSGVATSTLFVGVGGPDKQNFILDGHNETTSIGCNDRGIAWRCKAINFTAGAFLQSTTGQSTAIYCEATGCSTVSPFVTIGFYCSSHGNTVAGFAGGTYYGCAAYGNTGATTDGFGLTGSTAVNNAAVNCVSYGNGRDGFRGSASTNTAQFINCIAEGNAGWGFNEQGTSLRMVLLNCASFNNTLGRATAVTAATPVSDISPITCSVSPFTNAASADFSLNATATGGVLVRGAGYPALSTDGLTASAFDPGISQHADPLVYKVIGG